MNEDDAFCAKTEEFARNSWLRAVHFLLIVGSSSALLLTGCIVYKRIYQKVMMHANLKIMLASIMVLYIIVSSAVFVAYSRLQFVYLTHKDPCNLLIPTWMSLTTRAPMFLYVASFPLWHMALSLERLLATVKADRYEREPPTYGIVASVVVWILSVGFVTYVVCLAFNDATFTQPALYYILTKPTNSHVIVSAHWIFFAIDVCTCAVDVSLIFVNRQKLHRIAPKYSLSHSYQVNENMRVTTHLIVPLDICNAILFFFYLAVSTSMRSELFVVSTLGFAVVYDGIYVLLFLQAVASLGNFAYFSRLSKKSVTLIQSSAESDLFFEMFNKQMADSERQRRQQ